jgi:hypothetical protein
MVSLRKKAERSPAEKVITQSKAKGLLAYLKRKLMEKLKKPAYPRWAFKIIIPNKKTMVFASMALQAPSKSSIPISERMVIATRTIPARFIRKGGRCPKASPT